MPRLNEDEHDDDSPQYRLKEWGRSLHYEPWNYWPSESVFYGVHKLQGFGRTDAGAQVSDGGLGAMVDRMARSIAKDRRIQDTCDAIRRMPFEYRHIVDCLYRCTSAADTPRRWGEAVRVSGLPEQTFAYRRRRMLAWLAQDLVLRMAA